MSWLRNTFSYSIGRKIIMSLTGLFLVIFLFAHLASNLLLFVPDGGKMFNENSHYLTNNIFIRIVEILMFISFFFHIVDGIILWIQNRKARPVRYATSNYSANSMWTSRNMIISGSIIFIFLIIHLKTFFVPYRITGDVHDLYRLTADAFANELYAFFYVIAMILLGLHIHHGFASGFQTLGLRHPKYYAFIKWVGVIIAIVFAGAFAAMPLYFQFLKHFNA